jgi:hypothetical protein
MSMPISTALLQFVGILAVVAIVLIVFFRPGGLLPVALAVAVVVAAIIVCWRDVEQYRHQRALTEASQQAIASATNAAAAANAPHPRS